MHQIFPFVLQYQGAPFCLSTRVFLLKCFNSQQQHFGPSFSICKQLSRALHARQVRPHGRDPLTRPALRGWSYSLQLFSGVILLRWSSQLLLGSQLPYGTVITLSRQPLSTSDYWFLVSYVIMFTFLRYCCYKFLASHTIVLGQKMNWRFCSGGSWTGS